MKNHLVFKIFLFLQLQGSLVFAHPSRIVTLTPALGELSADLLGPEFNCIVGVSEYTDQPAILRSIQSVGPYVQVNLEKILALKPDLILASYDGNSKEQIEHLKALGLRVEVVHTNQFSEIAASMIQVGSVLGMAGAGQKMAMQWKQGLAQIVQESAPQKNSLQQRQRVLLQVGDSPFIVAGGNSMLNEALELLSAKNIYSDQAAHYPRPSYEDAVMRNPDHILILKMGGEKLTDVALIQKWMGFPTLKAAAMGHVQVLESDALLRPTLRMLEGLRVLAKALRGGV